MFEIETKIIFIDAEIRLKSTQQCKYFLQKVASRARKLLIKAGYWFLVQKIGFWALESSLEQVFL